MACYNLNSCNISLYPDITDVSDAILAAYVGDLISINTDSFKRYYVELIAPPCVATPYGIATVTVHTTCLTALPCGCPAGYTLDIDGICRGTINTPVTVNGTTYTAVSVYPSYYSPSFWGTKGATFYPDITLLPFPFTSSGGAVGTCFAGGGTRTTLTDSASVILPVITSVSNSVWGCIPNGGRLTDVGIWTVASPVNEWIGFTFCEEILTTKVYYIGIAGDDYYQLYIDGVLIVDHNTGFGFVDWKIFPITLNAGLHIFEARVKNVSLGPGGLGFEIYDATSAELQAITTANNTPGPTDLNQYIIFTTFDKIGQTWQTGEVSGYTCPSGYTLNTCDGLVCTSFVTTPNVPCDPPCGCPPGFVVDVNGNCVGTSSVPSILNPTIYIAAAGTVTPSYGLMGAVFYEDITFKPLPIIAGSGGFTIVTPLYDNLSNPILVTNQIQNNVWGQNPAGVTSRLNDVGIWTTVPPNPVNEWIGFTFCEPILTTKTYYIGIAADDVYRLTINGVLTLNHDYIVGFNNGYAFSSWKIIPITLNAGTNVILGEVYNFGSAATFGFEIYDATLAQLLGVVTANGTVGPTDLNQYIIFSTKDQIGQPWQTGTSSGYSCPAGYSLNICEGYTCTQISVIPPVDCCYLLTQCDGLVPPIVVTNDFNNLVDSIVKICPTNLPPAGTGLPVGSPVVDPLSYTTVWDLTDCCGTLPPMRVDNNLSTYQNGTIVIPSISATTCWRVVKGVTSIPITRLDLTAATYYVNCTECGIAFPCLPLPILTECLCFIVTKADDCQGSITLLNENSIEVFVDCETCDPMCFILTNCLDPDIYIVTNTDLTIYVGIGSISVNGQCWTVTDAVNCTGALPVVVDQVYTDCYDCLPKCYTLTDCNDPWLVLQVSTDLSPYVGQVVHIKSCGITCWIVEESIDCTQCYEVEVIESFRNCLDCAPVPPELPPIELHPRKVKPGYDTPGCPPEYTEKVNCNYGEFLYNEVVSKRYGIKVCCQEDKLKWEIKKHLLDLKSIYDPELCKSTLNKCCPPSCVVSNLYIFRGTTCPAPTSVTSVLFYPITCIAPDKVTSILKEV